MHQIINGNSLNIPLADNSVQCCVTSPPYFGLRDYGIDGQLGLEQTPAEYVANMVAVFREVWRVLKDDGVLWLNLGDSYAGSNGNGYKQTKDAENRSTGQTGNVSLKDIAGRVSSDLCNSMKGIIEGGVLFLSGRSTLAIAAKSESVLGLNNLTPNSKLTRLLGVKRILLKERNNDFCQVLNLLNPECDVWVSQSVPFVVVGDSTVEIVLDKSNGLRVVVSDGNLNTDTSFGVSARALAGVNPDMPFTVKESTEPVSKRIRYGKTGRDAVALDSIGESIFEIDAINQTVPFADTFVSRVQGLRNFSVTKASDQHVALLLMNGVVEFTCQCIGHLFISNEFGSLMRYAELYDKAKRRSNAMRPKQELGIPEMVKRALMEDGWICRSTIIWSKPNPMPESVTDRPTRAHEYIFLMAKQERYYYDHEAIKEPAIWANDRRATTGRLTYDGKRQGGAGEGQEAFVSIADSRNKRSVWSVATHPYKGAHFATFPPKLIEPCILAGSRPGDIVLDPFNGAGTTGLVALQNSRRYVGIELNPAYIKLTQGRLDCVQPKLTLEATQCPA